MKTNTRKPEIRKIIYEYQNYDFGQVFCFDHMPNKNDYDDTAMNIKKKSKLFIKQRKVKANDLKHKKYIIYIYYI